MHIYYVHSNKTFSCISEKQKVTINRRGVSPEIDQIKSFWTGIPIKRLKTSKITFLQTYEGYSWFSLWKFLSLIVSPL